MAPELGAGDGVLLFYTAHRNLPEGGYVEDQAVAVADRGLTRFSKFAGNPVLRTPGPVDFRDPKVIWHAPTSRWIMVVTHGQSIGIYSSPDALDWVAESEFGAHEGCHGPGPWECPDLFPIRIEGTGETAWILVVGLGNGHVSGGSGTQYFVGDFDGHAFTNRNAAETELFMDWGRDFYATQGFSGLGTRPLVIAWMSNWRYANHTPQSGFRGCMTLPRRLRLVETPEGLRLAQRVDPGAAAAFDPLHLGAGAGSASPKSPAFRLALDWTGPTGATLALSLFGESAPLLSIARTDTGYAVTVLREDHPEIAAEHDFATAFTVDIAHGARWT